MKSRKLLIVDDEPEIREVLKQKAELLNIDCQEANHGLEALQLLEKNEFDAILSDFNMPVMTGMELLQQMRNRGLQIPFVVITAFGDQKLVVQALKLGAFDFIEKPFELDHVFKIVESALELGAEINHWRMEPTVLETLNSLYNENTQSAISEIERVQGLKPNRK